MAALNRFIVVLPLIAGCHDFRGLTTEYGDSDLACVGCGVAAPIPDLGAMHDLGRVDDLSQGGWSEQGDFSTAQDLQSAADLTVLPVVGRLQATASVSQAHVDLTAEGVIDWVHWGYSPQPDRKATAAAQIGDYSTLQGGTILTYSNNIVSYSWTDGASPNPTVFATPTGIFVEGLNEGFTFSVPAGTQSQTLAVYVGGYHSRGELTASLSDGSASDYVDSSFSNSADGVPGIYDATYVLTFNAAAANQWLTIRWRAVSVVGIGNVTLQSAALR